MREATFTASPQTSQKNLRNAHDTRDDRPARYADIPVQNIFRSESSNTFARTDGVQSFLDFKSQEGKKPGYFISE